MSGILPMVVFTAVIAAVAVAFVLAATLQNDPNVHPPLFYASVSVVEQFQRPLCGCQANLPMGTDERLRSNAVFAQVSSVPDAHSLSSMYAFWWDFIAHDLVRGDASGALGNFTIFMTPSLTTTMTLTRAVYRNDAATGCREAQNFVTPLIDASTLYGDALNPLQATLRNGTLCKLRIFDVGEPHATENAVLSALHALWIREHNRLCDALAADFVEWGENERFWKARQIVIAKIQHITYQHWLPAAFGAPQMTLLSTTFTAASFPDTRITAEFGAAALHFSYSALPAALGSFTLSDLIQNATALLAQHDIGVFLQSSYSALSEKVDVGVVDALRNGLGDDVVARALFRGRDVGLAAYDDMKRCYLNDPLEAVGESEAFVALLQEQPMAGSALPRGIARIVAEQLIRTRIFDVNFYTRIRDKIGHKYYGEVLASTLGTVIAANTALVGVPNNVFFV